MNAIIDIIKSIKNIQSNVNPTEIYNEGWMTRLLVHHSINKYLTFKGIEFGKFSNWTSEALISSPFVKAEKNREGYTHADMALGDFSVDYATRGEIDINKSAKIFGIIEAKMGSNLSKGTTHAKEYNQASRNLACIAHKTFDSDCSIFFTVVAPEKKIIEHDIKGQVNLPDMISEIERRFSEYPSESITKENYSKIIAKAKSSKISVISYEEWLEELNYVPLYEFYDWCLHWNKIQPLPEKYK